MTTCPVSTTAAPPAVVVAAVGIGVHAFNLLWIPASTRRFFGGSART
jgi:hypothetical protein